jgi:hypothetical protein
MITETKLLDIIQKRVKKCGSLRKAEAETGVNFMYLSEICSKKRPITEKVAAAFGYAEIEQERKFEKIAKK